MGTRPPEPASAARIVPAWATTSAGDGPAATAASADAHQAPHVDVGRDRQQLVIPPKLR